MTAQELQLRLKMFAYRVVKLQHAMSSNLTEEIIIKQLVRSAFSSAANYRAACRAQTKKSFVSKLSIALEEIDESFFWLEVIRDLQLIKPELLDLLIIEAEELTKILSASRKKSLINTINKSTINKS